ncbi:S1-like domain-containing RNA-binding protein [uncultured Aquimarina sp.]|uniref:CvfB family protein n=1 Tax=uncultured Aquimarina sp. TaxID=575652 RepID=UPI0026399FE0|nr:S1-like domain-containing RNA-binding protein [uncultured Aquimarina sp.]
MLKLGEYNTLEIVREREQGVYLSDDDGNEVLLPNKYVPDEFMIRDEVKVFLYLDHEERIVATTLEPYATINSFGYLKCTTVSEIGAFMDWGLEKELFIPFREQASKMRVDSWYLVYVYLDKETNRLVGSSKTNAFLDNSLVLLSSFDEVDLIASHPSPFGWNMIVNQKHLGLVYEDEIFQKITPGDQLKGFVKKVRPDGKIDLTLQKHGYRAIEPNAQQILDELKSSGGFIDLNDKSDPNDIKDVFQLSKKSFKKAIGSLYKAKKIVIEKDGIRLAE